MGSNVVFLELRFYVRWPIDKVDNEIQVMSASLRHILGSRLFLGTGRPSTMD